MTTPRKETKRESRRQEKAEKAALLDKVSLCLYFVPFVNGSFVVFFLLGRPSGNILDNLCHLYCRVLRRNC